MFRFTKVNLRRFPRDVWGTYRNNAKAVTKITNSLSSGFGIGIYPRLNLLPFSPQTKM
jgi:hypothetical protein